jgi:hypothetical protein
LLKLQLTPFHLEPFREFLFFLQLDVQLPRFVLCRDKRQGARDQDCKQE